METVAEPPKQRLSYSKHNTKHQIAWDSTSLGALKRCPRYYQYNMIEGYSSRVESVHLRFGIEYNNALVIYNKSRAAGKDHETAVLDSVRYALVNTWDHRLNRPWVSDLNVKTRETLIRSIIWYLDKFEEDPLETVILTTGDPAVSLAFRLEIDVYSNLTGEPYLLCGELDRLVEFAGATWITDWKTSKSALEERYFADYSPNNQVSQYSFAGRIVYGDSIKGVIIDAVQLGVTFSRFQRAQIGRTPAQLEEWFHDALHYIRLNEEYVANNYWPMNDVACSMYGGCPYRAVCSITPELRQQHLDALYHRRSWDPLSMREI